MTYSLTHLLFQMYTSSPSTQKMQRLLEIRKEITFDHKKISIKIEEKFDEYLITVFNQIKKRKRKELADLETHLLKQLAVIDKQLNIMFGNSKKLTTTVSRPKSNHTLPPLILLSPIKKSDNTFLPPLIPLLSDNTLPSPQLSPIPLLPIEKSDDTPLITSTQTQIQQHPRRKYYTLKKFKCDICGKKYTKNGLKPHMRLHNGTTFKCDICGKKYTSKYGLKGHVGVHNGNGIRCDICGKKFKSRSGLKGHMGVHNGNELKCDIYGKQYGSKGGLKGHMGVHNGTSFKCDVCEKKYTTINMLRKHKCV